MKYDIEELKEFIKFYVSNYKDNEERLFNRYEEEGIEIKSDIYDAINILTIRDSIKHLGLEYSEDELKEVIELYEKYQDDIEDYINDYVIPQTPNPSEAVDELTELHLQMTLDKVIQNLS